MQSTTEAVSHAHRDSASLLPSGKQRLRVCLVGPSIDILGGQAIQAARLLERLGTLPELDVTFIPVNPRLPGILRGLQRVKYLRTVLTSVAYLASLLRRVPSCDVVHAFSASYFSYLLAPLPAMLVGRLYGKRVVLNYRSGEADDHLRRWRWSARTMRLAHAIVVPSAYLVEVFGRFGLKAQPILNFVDLDRVVFRARPRPRPVFLSNRNLEPLYNVACVLRSFAIIQEQFPDARLVVVGEGSQRGVLEKQAGTLRLRNVVFAGAVPPARMSEYYDAADVYLNAPNIDNMPNSIIEAFAAGLPVVTTDAGGIPYIATDDVTALLVPRDDHTALAEKALSLLRVDGLAERLSTQARAECLRRYVWPAVAPRWLELYRSLAAPSFTTVA